MLNRVVTLKESGVKKQEDAKGRSRKEEQARQLVRMGRDMEAEDCVGLCIVECLLT